MTSMPIIEDRMVYQLRRASKRSRSYSMDRSNGLVNSGSRVVPQIPECNGPRDNGKPCGYYPNMFCCYGECKFGRDC